MNLFEEYNDIIVYIEKQIGFSATREYTRVPYIIVVTEANVRAWLTIKANL